MTNLSSDISTHVGLNFQDPLTFVICDRVRPRTTVFIDNKIVTLNDIQLFFSGRSGFDRGAAILESMLVDY